MKARRYQKRIERMCRKYYVVPPVLSDFPPTVTLGPIAFTAGTWEGLSGYMEKLVNPHSRV